ncbi:hypothetical protein ACFLRI_02920 [Bacteroidota bacterium]
MKVYSLKVSLKKDPDVYRLIAIEGASSLLKLHHAILKVVDFEEGELASFYQNNTASNMRFEYCLSEMQMERNSFLMSEVKILDVLKVQGDELTYVYDFLSMWTFKVELESSDLDLKITDNLPVILKSEGENPVQDIFGSFNDENLSADDLDMLKEVLEKNDEYFDSDNEDAGFDSINDFNDFDDELSDFESLDSFEDDYSDDDHY